MNALVVGQSTKMADILSHFCDDIYIVIDVNARGLRYSPELDNYHVIKSDIDMSHPVNIISKAKSLKRLIKSNDIDIVFSQTKYDMVAAKLAYILLKRKVVLLGTSHNSYSWLNKSAVKQMSWLIHNTTDCFVALASFVYDQLVDLGIPENKLLLMPNTIEYNAWKVKKDYDSKTPFRMVYVAVVYPGKQQLFLVDLLNELLKYFDVEIDCYGDLNPFPDYVDEIENKINTLNIKDKFRLMGKIENSELRNIICEYDAYICPTKMEMSPVNILEAKAAGLPVIATNVGGIPDIINDNQDGLLFEFGNIADAVEKVTHVISDKGYREMLGNNARKQVSEMYTSKDAAIRLQNVVYDSLNKSK